jgi:hypothetical protein
VAVPAEVGAAFEVIQAEAVFEFSVVVFDAPADLGQPNQFPQRGVGRQVGQPVVGGDGFAGWPFGDQPARGEAVVGVAGNVAIGWAQVKSSGVVFAVEA